MVLFLFTLCTWFLVELGVMPHAKLLWGLSGGGMYKRWTWDGVQRAGGQLAHPSIRILLGEEADTYRNKDVHLGSRVHWTTKINAVKEKEISKLYFLRKLRSFNIRNRTDAAYTKNGSGSHSSHQQKPFSIIHPYVRADHPSILYYCPHL